MADAMQSQGRDEFEQTNLPVPAIGRTFAVLEYMCESGAPCTLKDIHTALKIPKTTAFSILKTLQMCGMAIRLDDGAYSPGMRLYTLGIGARMSIEKNKLFLPRLQRLRDETGYTIFFSIYDNGEQIVWDKVDGFESVYFRAYSGERKCLNTSSTGKAIAAFLPPDELEYALNKGMERKTENTITDRGEFKAHLAETRMNGYAVDDEEGERGVFCIGVPVFIEDSVLDVGKEGRPGGQGSHGHVYGAISMSTLKSRMIFPETERYITLLKAAAHDISLML